DRRREPNHLVLGVGADVGELLALEHVDFEVVAARVLADDHATINLPARLDHHRAAVFHIPHRVSHGLALIGRDQYPVAPPDDVAAMRTVSVKQTVHHRGAAG